MIRKQFYIPDWLVKALNEKSRKDNVSAAYIVRVALERYLGK